ncbi:transcriptional regulator [Pseudomonas lactis]|uniref:Helix-turn-helix domain-containing protein n=1 Tax=Pseudomonas lactis TaxID=1615674 RepID=A0A7Y1MJF5_9PSED|nr:YdaS family helix-turn-helix protein [Pseudomonas lactis]NNA82964.1 helix-turn-helix domain-containing protein [Pseudomonas lactis]
MDLSAVASAAKAVGSQTSLAKVLGCTPQNVQRMCATGRVPAKHVLKIEAASGVSRHELRPDLYPEASPTLNQMMPQIPVADQSGKPSVHSSSTAQASP